MTFGQRRVGGVKLLVGLGGGRVWDSVLLPRAATLDTAALAAVTKEEADIAATPPGTLYDQSLLDR